MGCKCSNRDIDFSKASSKEEIIELLELQADYIRREIQEIRENKISELSNSCSKINFLVTIHNESLEFTEKIRRINIFPSDGKFNSLTFFLNEFFACVKNENQNEHSRTKTNIEILLKANGN